MSESEEVPEQEEESVLTGTTVTDESPSDRLVIDEQGYWGSIPSDPNSEESTETKNGDEVLIVVEGLINSVCSEEVPETSRKRSATRSPTEEEIAVKKILLEESEKRDSDSD